MSIKIFKKVALVLTVIMLTSFEGSLPVYHVQGKGFYVDKAGNKIEGKFKFFYARTDSPSGLVLLSKKEREVIPFNNISKFVINEREYLPVDSITFEIKSIKKAAGSYTMKNVYWERRLEGRISYYVLRTLLVFEKDHWNWDALFLEKDGELIDLEVCSKGKSKKQCILNLMKDNSEIYQKWQKKMKFSIPHEINIHGYFKEYNGEYE
jgi:hypothetical protein